jgi:hypothetical protein
MTADLFLPILFIVVMFMIIRELDDALTLLMVALLFLPVALAFGKLVNNGVFTTLFQADITGLAIPSIILNLISAAMFTIPIFAGARIINLNYEIKKEAAAKKAGGFKK